MGLVVGCLCFLTAVLLLIATIISRIPNNNDMQRLDTEDIENNDNNKNNNNDKTAITSHTDNNFVSN